jgi:DNA-directed RNA polymerase specialized sigma24 family protein
MTDKVYEFLNGPKFTAEQIQAKKRKRTERLLAMVPGAIRYDTPRVQSSPSDRMSEIMGEVDELDQEIEDLRELLRLKRQEVADLSRRELDEQACRVIILRYIDGLQWRDVAAAVHRGQSTVFADHKRACEIFDGLL